MKRLSQAWTRIRGVIRRAQTRIINLYQISPERLIEIYRNDKSREELWNHRRITATSFTSRVSEFVDLVRSSNRPETIELQRSKVLKLAESANLWGNHRELMAHLRSVSRQRQRTTTITDLFNQIKNVIADFTESGLAYEDSPSSTQLKRLIDKSQQDLNRCALVLFDVKSIDALPLSDSRAKTSDILKAEIESAVLRFGNRLPPSDADEGLRQSTSEPGISDPTGVGSGQRNSTQPDPQLGLASLAAFDELDTTDKDKYRAAVTSIHLEIIENGINERKKALSRLDESTLEALTRVETNPLTVFSVFSRRFGVEIASIAILGTLVTGLLRSMLFFYTFGIDTIQFWLVEDYLNYGLLPMTVYMTAVCIIFFIGYLQFRYFLTRKGSALRSRSSSSEPAEIHVPLLVRTPPETTLVACFISVALSTSMISIYSARTHYQDIQGLVDSHASNTKAAPKKQLVMTNGTLDEFHLLGLSSKTAFVAIPLQDGTKYPIETLGIKLIHRFDRMLGENAKSSTGAYTILELDRAQILCVGIHCPQPAPEEPTGEGHAEIPKDLALELMRINNNLVRVAEAKEGIVSTTNNNFEHRLLFEPNITLPARDCAEFRELQLSIGELSATTASLQPILEALAPSRYAAGVR